ncbi:hypothetical protein KR222_004979, partial [Zaprionus bogoriensis]
LKAEGAAGLIDSEAEEAEDDEEDEDDDEEEEDDDEVEPGEVSKANASDDEDEAADSDEEPAEAPIGKKSSEPETKPKSKAKSNAKSEEKTVGIPKVPIARIPADTPKEKIVYASNLPKEYKHVDLIALFTKFGPIAVINRIKSKAGGNNVIVAFAQPEGAQATLAANEKALTLNGQVLHVSPALDKNELNARTVVVGLIGPNTTKEQVKEHFSSCGTIDSLNFSNNRVLPTAYVRFSSADSVLEALKLNGSELNSRYITVREESYKNKLYKSPEVTVAVVNTGNHESYKSDTLEKLFKKHGDIVDIDVVCTRGVLAFVTFKTAEQAQKAIKQLNGKTVDDLEIKLERYTFSSSARTILVTNLANEVDEQQLNEVFSESGEVDSVKLLGNKAIVKFTSDEAFCKSFLSNERYLHGQPIFIEPNSQLKHKVLQKKSA